VRIKFQRGEQRGHDPQIFRKYSHFAVSVAFFQTKRCYSPKIKHFGPPKNFGWLRHCLVVISIYILRLLYYFVICARRVILIVIQYKQKNRIFPCHTRLQYEYFSATVKLCEIDFPSEN